MQTSNLPAETSPWGLAAPRDLWAGAFDGVIVLASLILGWRLGLAVTRRLTEYGFEELFRPPWKTAPAAKPTGPEVGTRKRLRMARVAGQWVQWSIWLLAAWILTWQHNLSQLAGVLGVMLGEAWLLGAAALAALAVSRAVAGAAVRCVQNEAIGRRLDEYFRRIESGAGASRTPSPAPWE